MEYRRPLFRHFDLNAKVGIDGLVCSATAARSKLLAERKRTGRPCSRRRHEWANVRFVPSMERLITNSTALQTATSMVHQTATSTECRMVPSTERLMVLSMEHLTACSTALETATSMVHQTASLTECRMVLLTKRQICAIGGASDDVFDVVSDSDIDGAADGAIEDRALNIL